MDINILHEWNMPPREAVMLQKSLATRVVYNRPIDLSTVQTVAGVDVSVKDDLSRAAVVVMTFPDLEVIETRRAEMPTPFPYIPGLLSFREGPVLVQVFRQLETVPDVFLFDGMGRIHPRRLGIASHMGLWLNAPAVGCGKSHLIGEYAQPGHQKGEYTLLTHNRELLGVVLRTRTNVRPVYISPGHLIDLESAIELTLRCTPSYRLPEPIRQAHKAAAL